MACKAVLTWSLSGLVAAFLDLAIAYLVLCASAVAYLASKFLGLFGLNLPCPCDGIFIRKNICCNRLLVNFPTDKVSDVYLSVKQKFPFSDAKCGHRYDCSVDSDNCVNGIFEIAGEASCSSLSDARRSGERCDMKAKGVVLSHRPRSRLRRRGGGGDHGKNSLLLCYNPPLPEEEVQGWAGHFNTSRMANGFSEDDNKAPKRMRGRHRAVSSVEMNDSTDDDMHIRRSMLSLEELQNNQQDIQSFLGDDKNTIRFLGQKLKEERFTRAALYIELEKERSAAATAADEAMAMILRLQEEKASIEMEAYQYQRMTEEKSAYDAEEMNILKEIIVIMEKEKHCLEKEVEVYKQMVSEGNQELAHDGSHKSDAGQNFGPLLHPNYDPIFSLHSLTDSTDKKAKTENARSNENSGEMNLQKEEIKITGKDVESASKALLGCQKIIPLRTEELEQVQEMNQAPKTYEKIIVTCNGNENQNYDRSLKKQDKNALLGSSRDLKLEKDHRVHGVHIINNDINFCSEAIEGKIESNFDRSTCRLETEADVKRRSPEITRGLPPIGPRGLTLSGVRRSSTSAMDSEMVKIDSEIGRLRERLKLVQEGREKLGLTMENREREKAQLKLLEDLARQIQEIQRLTEPGRVARQASLPPPTSKASSKKRRSRSVSSGFQMSSEG